MNTPDSKATAKVINLDESDYSICPNCSDPIVNDQGGVCHCGYMLGEDQQYDQSSNCGADEFYEDEDCTNCGYDKNTGDANNYSICPLCSLPIMVGQPVCHCGYMRDEDLDNHQCTNCGNNEFDGDGYCIDCRINKITGEMKSNDEQGAVL